MAKTDHRLPAAARHPAGLAAAGRTGPAGTRSSRPGWRALWAGTIRWRWRHGRAARVPEQDPGEEAGSRHGRPRLHRAHAGEFFAALKQWLRIPSISADPARRRRRAGRSAEWLADTCGRPGSRRSRSGRRDAGQPGLPAVFAEWPAADPARADRAASTATTTCSRSTRSASGTRRRSSRPSGDGQLLARGASDDKGQVLFHAARRPARDLAATGRPPRRSRSSCSSRARRSPARRTSPTCCGRERDRLACDVSWCRDTAMWAARRAVDVHGHARA